MKFKFSRQILEKKKHSNIKFHENPSSGSRIVPCGRTDIKKLKRPFRNFAKAPKNPFNKTTSDIKLVLFDTKGT